MIFMRKNFFRIKPFIVLAGSAALLTMMTAVGCTSKNSKVASAREKARTWDPSLAEVFDDELDYRTLATLSSDEPFAVEARSLLRKRISHADMIIWGEVLNIADLVSTDGIKRRGILVKIERMLSGERKALPKEEKDQISLVLSNEHPDFSAEQVVGKNIVLFLRWLPGTGEPAFHWHGNISGGRLVHIIERVLQMQKAGKDQPKRKDDLLKE
jgi:hypothetical protein